MPRVSKGRVYAVRVGRQQGLFYDWDECKQSVTRFPGAEYKSFKTEAEAAAYITRSTGPRSSSSKLREPRPGIMTMGGVVAPDAVAALEQFQCPVPSFMEQEIASRNASITLWPGADSPSQKSYDILKPVDVYTDGACVNNGNLGSKGGIGVFFGPGDPRNISEPLPGPTQTNNRSEILAAIRGIQAAPPNPIRLLSDSMYVNNGITSWISKWKRNGWKTATGKPVLNVDLWILLDEVIEKRKCKGWGPVAFVYVKAHSGIYGNEQADSLAVLGAKTR